MMMRCWVLLEKSANALEFKAKIYWLTKMIKKCSVSILNYLLAPQTITKDLSWRPHLLHQKISIFMSVHLKSVSWDLNSWRFTTTDKNARFCTTLILEPVINLPTFRSTNSNRKKWNLLRNLPKKSWFLHSSIALMEIWGNISQIVKAWSSLFINLGFLLNIWGWYATKLLKSMQVILELWSKEQFWSELSKHFSKEH